MKQVTKSNSWWSYDNDDHVGATVYNVMIVTSLLIIASVATQKKEEALMQANKIEQEAENLKLKANQVCYHYIAVA